MEPKELRKSANITYWSHLSGWPSNLWLKMNHTEQYVLVKKPNKKFTYSYELTTTLLHLVDISSTIMNAAKETTSSIIYVAASD